jgi:predicted short-subunit dehydrogenase-like oxidoreductase (DUF2520 family)
MEQCRVNLVGAGRVGKTLLGLMKAQPGVVVQDVLSARVSSAQEAIDFLGTGRVVEALADMAPADLWILAVPDTRIAEVADGIAAHVPPVGSGEAPPIAFHCSGFFSSNLLRPLGGLGWQVASLHPVLSFADPAEAMRQFPGTHCGVEGDAGAVERLEKLLTDLGAIPFELQADSKSLYHAAAVISNNFTVVLQAIAREAWAQAGVPDDIAAQLNANLLRATCENVTALGPQHALTGPAARGDRSVVTQQGADVARWHPEAGALYEQLSTLAARLKTLGRTTR